VTLRAQDQAYLERHDIDYTALVDGDGIQLILKDVGMPDGLQPSVVDVLITLPAGFNDIGPDMFWCSPDLTRRDGLAIPATNRRREFQGRSWQRWSRHIGGGWRPGIDNLATYVAYIRRAIAESATKAA
jgi:hypothetical protein